MTESDVFHLIAIFSRIYYFRVCVHENQATNGFTLVGVNEIFRSQRVQGSMLHDMFPSMRFNYISAGIVDFSRWTQHHSMLHKIGDRAHSVYGNGLLKLMGRGKRDAGRL